MSKESLSTTDPRNPGWVKNPQLARHIVNVPAQEIPPEAPPLPTLPEPFGLRPAHPEGEDPTLVSEWMNRPHLVDTWEQPWPLERWRDDWNAKLATTYARPSILTYDGRDVGYMEFYYPHQDEIRDTYTSAPHDLGFHIAVGEEELTGKKIFSPLFRDIPLALFAASPACDLIVVEPDYRNDRVHRGLRSAGWLDCGERQQRPDRRVRLFAWERTPNTFDNRSR